MSQVSPPTGRARLPGLAERAGEEAAGGGERERIGLLLVGDARSEYFQETHPEQLFRECSVYCELVNILDQLPRVLEMAMRAALARGGVAVVVIVPVRTIS